MAFLSEIHIWSSKVANSTLDNHVGCYMYHDKIDEPEGAVDYLIEKEKFTESRGIVWTLKNKRPEKLRDTLRDVEDILQNHICVKVKWLTKSTFQMLMNTGMIITITINKNSGDFDRMFIDRSLINILSSEQISDAIMTQDFFLICHHEKLKLDYIRFGKKISYDTKKFEKLSSFDPKNYQIETPGSLKGMCDWQLTFSNHQELALLWNRKSSQNKTPLWSPMTTEREKANMSLFALDTTSLVQLVFKRTEGELLHMSFSIVNLDNLISVEETVSPSGEIKALVCTYEFGRNRIDRISSTNIQLSAPIRCCEKSSGDEYVLLSCEDNTVILFERSRKLLVTTAADVVPCFIAWHPKSVIAVVGSMNGELQVFDIALSKISFTLPSDDVILPCLKFSSIFRNCPSISSLLWNQASVEHPDNSIVEQFDDLVVFCKGGPMVLVRIYFGATFQGQLGSLSLVHEYIKMNKVEQAVSLLKMLNWNLDGNGCLSCLYAIMNHLLKQPLTVEKEALLESSLATFLNPVKPLPEGTILQFRDAIYSLTRRFFHHLLRYHQLEKSYLLAIDIGSSDLFMDLYYVAIEKGEKVLSEVCLQRANQNFSSSAVDSVDTTLCKSDSSGDSDHSTDDIDDQNYIIHDQVSMNSLLRSNKTIDSSPVKSSRLIIDRKMEYLDRKAALLALQNLKGGLYNNPVIGDGENKDKKIPYQKGQFTVINFGSV